MLNGIRAFFNSHALSASGSVKQLSRQPLSNFITIVIIAVALTLPALFWLLTDNLNEITKHWQQGSHISLYLKKSATKDEQMHTLFEVQQISGVGQASYISSDEGLQLLKQQEGMSDILQSLPENPLPSVIEVIPALSVHSPKEIEHLFTQLKQLEAVEQAKLDMQWINRLHAFLGFAKHAAAALMLLLAVAVILIIGNTLRLALYHRHEEIQVLKLIGATDSFILRPFLYSGILYGLSGALIAVILVHLFLLSMNGTINQLIEVYQMHFSFHGMTYRDILLLLLFASILGWLGARLSVKRQMSFIEPYK